VVRSGIQGGCSGGESPGRGWEFFSSPSRPERFWGPSSPLCNGIGTGGSFPRGKAADG
jgi:hypothetical protein